MIENRQISLLTMRLRKAFRSLRTFEHCRAFHSLSLSCVEKLLRGRRKKSFKNAYKLRKVGTSFPLKYTLNTILIYRAAFLTRTLHSFHNNREKVMPSKNHIHRRFNAFTWELFLDKYVTIKQEAFWRPKVWFLFLFHSRRIHVAPVCLSEDSIATNIEDS